MATHVTAIVQARMGSTRLPGKVMRELSGHPLIWHVFNRLGFAKTIKKIVLATTTLADDDVIAELATKMGVSFCRGSEDDVLDRYYQAATRFGADHIIRITADCPLIDPEIIDNVVKFYFEKKKDYVSIGQPGGPPTFPDGLDVEVFAYSALQRAWEEAKRPSEREHVTPYIINNPKMFALGGFDLGDPELAKLRLTVDDEEDFELVTKIYKELHNENNVFLLTDILRLLNAQPELLKINEGTIRNEGYLKSLKKDQEM